MYWCKPSWLWFCLVILKIITSVSLDITFDNDYPKDATTAETKEARFDCLLYKEHEPTDQVSWMKHDKKINQSSEHSKYYFGKKRITDRICEYSLTIDPVERSDATDYRCVFDTSTGLTSSRKAYLNVLKIPSTEYPMCYFSQPSYYISDDVQIMCISEKTSTDLSIEFTQMTELASIHENSNHTWKTLEFPAIPSINNTQYGCKLYIDVTNEWRNCYTDPLLILSKLRVVIDGDTQYSSNQMAHFICKGNYTDTANITWNNDNEYANTNQLNNNSNKTIQSELPEMCGTQLTCTNNEYVNTNQVNSNNANKLTIPSVLPEMHGTQLTCTIEDEDFTGSDTVILTVEHMTTRETTRKPSTISTIYTVPLKEVETVIPEKFEIIKHFVVVCLILITLIMLCCILLSKLFKKEKVD